MGQANLSVLLQGRDNLTPVIKNAQKSLTDLGSKSSKLDDIQKGFDKIQNSSVPLSKKIKDIKKQMEQLIVTGQKETTEGKRMWAEMSKAAQKYDEQLKQIQKDTKSTNGLNIKDMGNAIGGKLGLGGVGSEIGAALTNPYLLAGVAIAGAGKALYDYNVELDRSLQKTAQFTGLSGDELMNLRNGIKSVADTFGTDYDSVLSTVDGMMNQFGISGEEALKTINDGFIAMGEGGAQKVLDLVNQYQGSFNDAGISASELVAIIGNTRSGIFSEEGMELFAKGAKNIREFSSKLSESLTNVGINAEEMYEKLQSGKISTVDAIKQISEKLKDLNPQSQEVGEVLKQVFGKQGASAGLELVTALSEVETNLEVVKTQTGEWGEAMEQLQQADRELENAMSRLFGVANGGFSTMTTKLKAEVYGAVANVINGFIDWYNKSLLVRGIIANIAVTFKNTWEIIKGILKLFMNSVKALGGLIEGVLTLDWQKVKSSWKDGMSNILKTIATGFENIKDNMTDAVEQTLHGEIKPLEVPVETTYSPNKHGVGGGGNTEVEGTSTKGDKGGKTKSTKTEVVKTELELKEEELKKVESQVQNAISRFNKGLITKDELRNSVDEANKYFQENGIKEKVELEFSDTNGFEQVKQKTVQKLLSPIEEAKKKYDEAVNQLNSVNPFEITEERLNELKQNVIDTENTYNRLKEALSTTITPSIQNIDKKQFERGSVEDKRQSLANANSIAEQYKSDYKLGLIGFDEVQQKFAELNQQLQELDPKLKLDLHINDDGTITTAQEDIENAKNKLDTIKDTVGSVGSVFGSLGSAIGGAGGEALNFAGTMVSAIGQIIPQIVALIGASQAQAIAEGTASGAGLPFPANLAAIASIVATIVSVFSSLPKFAEGGVVGGTSYSGDKVLARLNSGEGVLTRRGMNNLQNVMNSSENTSSVGGSVKFEIDGTKLKGVLNNVNRKISKQS